VDVRRMVKRFAIIVVTGMLGAGMLVAQAPEHSPEQGPAQYKPQFAGDPARSDAEAQALGYMRVVLRAQNTYKRRHGKYAESLAALAGTGSFTKRMAATIAGRKAEPNERAERLVEAIKAVLNEAIKSGGSSLRDHRRTDGDLGMFQHNFRVYDREGEPCQTPGCGGTVKRIVQNGRSTFYCPACQK